MTHRISLRKMTSRLIFGAIAAVTVLTMSPETKAQFHWGPKVGINVNSLHFNNELLNTDNRTGFTGGLMMEFTAPIINLGFDMSVLYVRRNNDYTVHTTDNAEVMLKNDIDYMSIPINFKWKIGIPVVQKIIKPFFTTGPDFAFRVSKRHFMQAYKNRKVDVNWNFGFGLELLSRVQVAAAYGVGITKAVETVSSFEGAHIDGRTRCWTVTAAYLF